MCGIIAYTGSKPVTPILVSGLRTLEYRGYDSAGIGVQNGSDRITVTRALGVDQLAEAVAGRVSNGDAEPTVCIAHTRWATHGGVTLANAHPHPSADRRVSVVHTGVVDNDLERRAQRAQPAARGAPAPRTGDAARTAAAARRRWGQR